VNKDVASVSRLSFALETCHQQVARAEMSLLNEVITTAQRETARDPLSHLHPSQCDEITGDKHNKYLSPEVTRAFLEVSNNRLAKGLHSSKLT